jgi:hypothetical protein
MKTKNNDNEVVKRKILKEAFEDFEKGFTASFTINFMESLMPQLLGKIEVMIDTKIGDLAIMIQKGFLALHGEIRGEMKVIDMRADVSDLKVCIIKLEKKVKH